MAMSPQLKASLTDEEREATGAIGTTGDGALDDKISELFRTLNDPLLSVEDAAALLVEDNIRAVEEAMTRLVEAKVLESSHTTQRPLDEGEVELFRLTDVPVRRLKVAALEARLPNSERSLYQWTADGRIVRSIARVSRLDAISGSGAQRNEIRKHVMKISEGIHKGAQIPNSLLLVFIEDFVSLQDITGEDEVPGTFIRIKPLSDFITNNIPGSPSEQSLQQVRVVEIDFPYRRAAFDDEKVALLVDGQQRTAGLSLVPVDDVPQFDFPVNAVVADEDEAKQVFTLANQTVKIATDFERALVASMGEAPPFLRSERVPAQACHSLAISDAESPFHGIVRYPGLKPDKAHVVAYNTLFLIAHNFCFKAKVLDKESSQDAEKVAWILGESFKAVRDTWPEAWAKRPGESKLMHGAGLRSIASIVFDMLYGLEVRGFDLKNPDAWRELRRQLKLLAERIVWTQEAADKAPVSVKETWEAQIRPRQNTSQDIVALTESLKDELREALKHQPAS